MLSLTFKALHLKPVIWLLSDAILKDLENQFNCLDESRVGVGKALLNSQINEEASKIGCSIWRMKLLVKINLCSSRHQ